MSTLWTEELSVAIFCVCMLTSLLGNCTEELSGQSLCCFWLHLVP